EHAKRINELEYQKKEEARIKRQESNEGEEFDLLKNKELLEWSRSDSPVRMYLREMGKVPLLTKEEEIEISQHMEKGENTILDAICSVPYLIDFILEYKEPLVNRERKVKELFKNFDDDNESEDAETDVIDELDEEAVVDNESKSKDKKLDKRAQKIIEAFKLLEKAK
ncbi:RNA polymerase sigma factor RpoD, partial [Aduncisulcus paluster]